MIESSMLVLFGASGDLAYKKLFPAIYSLYSKKKLSKKFILVGVGRSDISDKNFRDKVYKSILENIGEKEIPRGKIDAFLKMMYFQKMDTMNFDDYATLRIRLKALGKKYKVPLNITYYLSTPPSVFGIAAQGLAKFGLNKEDDGWKRIVVEKPFGKDFVSANTLNYILQKYFDESQIFRIDHYLGKETVQNLLVLRFSNAIFEPLWNRSHIDYVEITAAESFGITGRAGYYDQSGGAIRDMIQNHLMQVMAMVGMEYPKELTGNHIRDEVAKVIQSVKVKTEKEMARDVVVGQYQETKFGDQSMHGYTQEEGVDTESRTESYAAIKFEIDNERWKGVPFYVRSGKCLTNTVSEVVINFKRKQDPHFCECDTSTYVNNQLVIRIQPDEGVVLKFGLKEPGERYCVKSAEMDFHYSDLKDTYIPVAYEKLILDALQGDASNFARSDSVEASWKIIDPIINYIREKAPMNGYDVFSWGPQAADELVKRAGHEWNDPCKKTEGADGNVCLL